MRDSPSKSQTIGSYADGFSSFTDLQFCKVLAKYETLICILVLGWVSVAVRLLAIIKGGHQWQPLYLVYDRLL